MEMSFEELLREGTRLNEELPGRRGSLVERTGAGALVVVGDLHGELDSFKEIIEWVKDDRCLWLFLGDYVDRGAFGVELLTALLQFQLERPDRVILLRGNHEDWEMNYHYTFADELRNKGLTGALPSLLSWYDSLPLAAKVGELAAVHGGVPIPVPEGIDELEKAKADDDMGFQMLWNDPLDESYWPRGGGTRPFDEGAMEAFLSLLDCRFLIRGHQYVPNVGYKVNFGRCVTIFSASYGMGWPRAFLYLSEGHVDSEIEAYVIRI